MIDLRSIIGGTNFAAPALDVAPIQYRISQVAPALGLETSLLQSQLERRLLPDIESRQAGRGAFHSSATQHARGRAREDVLGAQSMATAQASERIRDLIMSMGLLPFGRSL